MAASATMPTSSLIPLAPFAHAWVGGDIRGLAAFAGTLYGYVPQIEDVVTVLDKKVGQIVGDAGWQGPAASAFTGNWEKVSAEANALGLVIIQTGRRPTASSARRRRFSPRRRTARTRSRRSSARGCPTCRG